MENLFNKLIALMVYYSQYAPEHVDFEKAFDTVINIIKGYAVKPEQFSKLEERKKDIVLYWLRSIQFNKAPYDYTSTNVVYAFIFNVFTYIDGCDGYNDFNTVDMNIELKPFEELHSLWSDFYKAGYSCVDSMV